MIAMMEGIWIAVSIVALVIIAIFVIYTYKGKKKKELSKLAMLGMTLIILGIIFGDGRLIGYGFIGTGVLLAVIDIIQKSRKKK